eukprot:5033590-Pyramimonas_sp.AAC.1
MVNGSKDDVEVYGSSFRGPPCTAVLDTACQMTMHGTPWRISYEKELLDRKLNPIPRSQQTKFRGVGGD